MPPKTAAAVTGIKNALAEELRKWLARIIAWLAARITVEPPRPRGLWGRR